MLSIPLASVSIVQGLGFAEDGRILDPLVQLPFLLRVVDVPTASISNCWPEFVPGVTDYSGHEIPFTLGVLLD